MIRFVFFCVFLIIMGVFVPEELYSQNRRLERADRAFEMQHYDEAIELYGRVRRRYLRGNREDAARISFNTAMCFRYTNQSRRAESTFRRAIRQNYPDPVAYLYMAEAMMQNEKYEDAIEVFKQYQEKEPDDKRADLGIASAKFALEMIDSPSRYEVETIRRFNTRGTEYTPAFADHRQSSVVFASSREEAVSTRIDPWTGENFTSFFISFRDVRGNWSNPVLLDEGPVNTSFNEGAPSFNASYTTMYFTRCPSVTGVEMGCRIYKSDLSGSDWGDPVELNLVNDSAISIGHPAVSPDELSLYFVTDQDGGHGGNDIWVAKRDTPSGEFNVIQNLDSVINTAGDEMFPYIRDDGVLFFASNGHPGLGGLDIFYSIPDGESWSEPVNLGIPINSSGDDFGIVFYKGRETGFFSSNRGRAGMFNIYSFHLPPLLFTIAGTVRDDITKQPLEDATIQMIGSDGSLVQVETDEKGQYFFDNKQVQQDTRYDLLVSKEKYFSSRGQETTEGIRRSRDFVNDFYLEPIPETPIELPAILYEFASWELQPQYQDSLVGLIQTLEDNPGLIIELASHTDSRGSHAYNDTLSQKRAQSVVDFLAERGIDERRLMAKGYGKRVPRVIEDSLERDGFIFEKGVELTEEYINSLAGEEHRDVAHQLNRRTEFRVLSEDFDPEEETEKRSDPSREPERSEERDNGRSPGLRPEAPDRQENIAPDRDSERRPR